MRLALPVPAGHRLTGLTVALALAAGCGTPRVRPSAGAPGAAPGPAAAPTAPTGEATPPGSNILRGDYVGSEACGRCHARIYEAWRTSPMHLMTRAANRAPIRAPFDGRTFTYKGDELRLEQEAGERFMRIRSAGEPERLYRVTRVIGGRAREDFAGVEVASTAPGAPIVGPPGQELILPASYVLGTGGFRLKGYSVMVGERPGLRAGGVWNRTCVFCHNTNPYLDSLLGELHGPKAPGYQGEVVDRVLPDDRRWRYQIRDGAALEAALRDEIAFVGGAEAARPAAALGGKDLLARTMVTLRERVTPAHFVELGIGCESCHGGGREHVADAGTSPSFLPRAPFLDTRTAAGAAPSRAEAVNRACARCHQVLFSHYPYTWEGGRRTGAGTPGGSHISSGEARDMLLGGCARQMACTACHDPHALDRRERLDALGSPAGNGVCVGCHARYAGEAALRAHSHHDPAGAGAACVACHMPRKNMGLGYDLTRYHRIGSPTEKARVEGDRPLECALCHARKSAAQILGDMQRFWGTRVDHEAVRRLYGDLDAPVLMATLRAGRPHEQAVAIAVLGETRDRDALPAVARELTNRIPLVRYFARQALERITGAPCPIDLDREAGDIRAEAERWVAGAVARPSDTTRPSDATP